MKTQIIYLATIIYVLLCPRIMAQGYKADTIKVNAGKLSTQLGDKRDIITSLTLKGEINGSDITTIRSMAKLTVLNLADVDIVKGGTFISSIYDDKIEIPNNEIPEEMLYEKDKLIAVTLPENITAIGLKSFSDCSKLGSMVIPDKVISIGTNAFFGCTSLKELTIPASVTTIDYGAFQSCSALSKIRCKGTNPVKITNFTFYGVSTGACKVYVPIGAAAAYKAAEGWKEFKNIIEE